jgi:hypothetical protein
MAQQSSPRWQLVDQFKTSQKQERREVTGVHQRQLVDNSDPLFCSEAGSGVSTNCRW